MDTGSTWEEKMCNDNTGTFGGVKRKGRAEREKQGVRDTGSAETLVCAHANGRQGKKFVCYSVGRESSQRGPQVKCLMPFLSLQKAGLLRQLTGVAKPWESGWNGEM